MAEETYTIKRNDVLGRYIVAKRSLKQGEIILKEQPTLIGPQICGSMICFKCCNNLRNGYISCLRCKIAPICTPKCVGRFHDNIECDLMAKTSLTTEMIAHYSQIIFPLRCLLLKQANSQLWEEIMALESHLEARRNSAIWRQHRINVEKVLLQLKLINEVDLKEEIIQKICGIIDVNTFEVRSPEMCQNMAGITNPTALCLRGLYLKAALMAHNCTANTSVSIDNNFTLTITASVDIPENSVIFINYANVLQGNLERKQHLREGKYFQCICKRCKDSTELGTNLSTLVCYKCRNGLIRMKSETEWGCSRCKFVVRNCLIHLTVEQAKRNLEDVDQTDISAMELLLRKFSTTFHSNHYLNVELKQFLIGAYSRLVKIHKKQLLRKIFLCKELLDVINILEPGISRLNSITKYELHAAEVILAHKLFNSQEIQQDEFVERLLVAEKYLKDAIKGLLYEPVNSPEGILAQKALSELKLLRMSTINVNLTSGEETKAKNMLVGRKTKKEASVKEINVDNDQKLANSNKNKKNKKSKSGRKKE